MSLMIKLLSALLIFAALPAHAQSVTGDWDFFSENAAKGCTISGRMTIDPPAANGISACHFVSEERCAFYPAGEMPMTMTQDCRVITQGKFIIITSTVTGSLTDWHPETSGYRPDSFNVKPVDGQPVMKGTTYDGNWTAPVIFRRPDPDPVS